MPGLAVARGVAPSGVLEVLAVCTPIGPDDADRDTGARLVRWVAEPDDTVLMQPPEEADAPSAACQIVLALPGTAAPGRRHRGRRNPRPPRPWKNLCSGPG